MGMNGRRGDSRCLCVEGVPGLGHSRETRGMKAAECERLKAEHREFHGVLLRACVWNGMSSFRVRLALVMNMQASALVVLDDDRVGDRETEDAHALHARKLGLDQLVDERKRGIRIRIDTRSQHEHPVELHAGYL